MSCGALASTRDQFRLQICDKGILEQTGLGQLVVAGGVGANRRLRERLDRAAAEERYSVFYPEFEFCTDNGAMIALAGALRLGALLRTSALGAPCLAAGSGTQNSAECGYGFTVKPRWDLSATDALE